ncbi:hypothetical protein OQA88_10074 [Cercophora sp. LCS_1]
MNPLAQSPQSAAAADALTGGLKGRAIILQNLYIHGVKAPRPPPQDVRVEANTIPAGGIHTVSAQFVAQRSGFSLAMLIEWTKSGGYFCQLEWKFPGTERPKFSTRHVLVDDGSNDICFSGGFGWAIRLLELFQGPVPGGTGSDGEEQESNNDAVSQAPQDGFPPREAPKLPKAVLSQAPPQPKAPPPLEHPPFEHLPYGGTPVPDASEVFDQPGSPDSLIADTASCCTANSDSESEYGGVFSGNRTQTRCIQQGLGRRWRAAEAQYRRNGDTNAYFTVLNTAAGYSHVWSPSGLPRF